MMPGSAFSCTPVSSYILPMVVTAPDPLLITGGSLVLPDRVLPGGALLLAEGKVRYAGPRDGLPPLPPGCREVDADGGYVTPTLWEPHIHGCGGTWTGDTAPENLRVMAAVLAREGVGIFLPTTISDDEVIEDLGNALQSAGGEPGLAGRIPGIYVEGPFVSHSKRGGIPESCLKPVSLKHLNSLVEVSRNHIRMMTFAPELPGASDLCGGMRERGILPALGHSDARLPDLEAYENGGLLAVTHLFNGMSGVSHREPGLALWALMEPDVYTELICDGTHVHPAAIALALRLRPHSRIVLISDGVALAGVPEAAEGAGGAAVSMYGRKVTARGTGVYFTESGVLVGSRLLVRDGVSRLIRELGVPVPDAVAMATLSSATLLGFERKGALVAGKDADAAVFSPDFSRCSLTVFEGRILHALASRPADTYSNGT